MITRIEHTNDGIEVTFFVRVGSGVISVEVVIEAVQVSTTIV